MQSIVHSFFDQATYTFSHVVHDSLSMQCAIIDSVLDFDYASGTTSYTSANKILDFVDSLPEGIALPQATCPDPQRL